MEMLTASLTFNLKETAVICLAVQSRGRNVVGNDHTPSLLNSSRFVLCIEITFLAVERGKPDISLQLEKRMFY
jgi:hypothetical protein